MKIVHHIFGTTYRAVWYRLISLIVALNYFAFRTELYEDEYKENHPDRPDTVSFTLPALNWETFDKDNAPKAFVIILNPPTRLICVIADPVNVSEFFYLPYQPVRDKSPPWSFYI